MFEVLERALAEDERLAYGLVFGSWARGENRARSDLDVAVGLAHGQTLSLWRQGELVSHLEAATGLEVDLVLVHEAPPALAWRIFLDGVLVLQSDRSVFVRDKARAIVDYLDFRPTEQLCVEGALRASRQRVRAGRDPAGG